MDWRARCEVVGLSLFSVTSGNAKVDSPPEGTSIRKKIRSSRLFLRFFDHPPNQTGMCCVVRVGPATARQTLPTPNRLSCQTADLAPAPKERSARREMRSTRAEGGPTPATGFAFPSTIATGSLRLFPGGQRSLSASSRCAARRRASRPAPADKPARAGRPGSRHGREAGIAQTSAVMVRAGLASLPGSGPALG